MFARTLLLSGIVCAGLLVNSAARAQTGPGNMNGGAGTGTGTSGGVGDSPLGFDAGVTLERTERATRDPNEFVGAAPPTVGNFGAASEAVPGATGRGGLNQQGQFFNFFNQLNRANQQFNNQRNQLRIPVRLGYAAPPSAATSPVIARQVGTQLQNRFTSLERFDAPISVAFEGNTLVLSGRVADAETRRLAERLVLLEPGVYKVRNELEVVAAVGPPEVLPAPRQ